MTEEEETPARLEKTFHALDAFTSVLRTDKSARQYVRRLSYFFDHLHLPGTIEEQAEIFFQKAQDNKQWAHACLMDFIDHYKKKISKNEISPTTLSNYYVAVKVFCEMNNIELHWKRIRRGLPRPMLAADDRAPSLEEIKKLCDYPDRRIKPIVYTMCSSGIRSGAWDDLKWKHITPLYSDQNGKQVIVAAKIIVYAGSPDKYYSFLTPEAYYALKQWMDYRASDGEVISGESWIMWDLWRTTNVKHGANRSLATNPRQLKASAIKKLLQRALWALNLRPVLPKGERRHEWKSSHGYRKYFKSRAEQIMRPLHVELLMGHSVGVSDSYARPTEQEMLQDYIRGVDYLTVNTDQKTTIQLQKQVSELKEEREQNNYTIMGRLAEKDKQIADLQKEQQNIFEFFKTNMQIMVRNTIAQELDETTKKENPGIKKLIQRGNYAIHWGTARREEEENNPSGSWGS